MVKISEFLRHSYLSLKFTVLRFSLSKLGPDWYGPYMGFDHVEITQYPDDPDQLNIVGYNWGRVNPDEYIVIGGHFDIAYMFTPPGGGTNEGSNDDTSGSTVSLEVGQALAQMEFDHTVVAALWACEEEGLLGSLAYVANLPENVSVRTYMNFDMVSLNYPIVPLTEPLIDPLTGDKVRDLSLVKVYANSHYITPKPTIEQAIINIKKELDITLKKHKAENKLLEAQRLEERTKFDLEMIEATGSCAGIENYSRFLSGRKPGEPPPTLFEYFPDNTLIFVDECHVTVPQLNGMYKGDRSRKSTLAEYGFRLPSCMDNRPLKFEEWDLMRTQTVFVSATPGPWELEQTKGKYIDQVIRPTGLIDPPVEIRPAKNQVDDLMHECKKVIENNHRVLVTTLTKKMAEDLTEYLHENGIKVRYLHSDIDTLERIEIMRDLRMGVFDVLVGINLLREGLDIPECAMVGILDADKEGFLRSETSLIQTIGRAARNIEGKVILYADKETKSIKKAIQETERRRKIQLAYNKKHNIDAKTVKKEISDILESVYEKDYVKISEGSNIGGNLKKHLKGLDKKMKEAASNLEFEEAAKIRDEIRKLQTTELEITLNPKIRQYDVKNKIYPKGRSTLGMPGTRVTKKKDKKWKQKR